MRSAPPLKLVTVEKNATGEESQRNPRALLRLDWVAVFLLAGALFIAPLLAGDFSTSAAIPTLGTPFQTLAIVGMPILLLLIGAATLVTVWREWQRPVAIGMVPGLAGSFGLLGLWSVLTFLHSHDRLLSLNALVTLFAALLLGTMVSRLARDRQALVALLFVIVSAAGLVAIVGVVEYARKVAEHVWIWRTFATFSDPNFLAGFLLICLPITLALFASVRPLWLKGLLGLDLILQSACLWLSGSRGGSGIVLVGLAVFVLLGFCIRISRPRRQALIVGLALFVVGSAPALTPLLSRLGHHAPPAHVASSRTPAPASDAQENSNQFRRWTWVGTVRMANANPILGVGVGAFEYAYPRYAETAYTAHAHNSYLQWMSETGYPGVLMLLGGLAAVAAFATHTLLLRRQRTQEAQSQDTDLKQEPFLSWMEDPDLLLVGLLSALLNSLLHNLTDSDWYIVANLFLLAALVALLVALARDLAPLSTQRPRPLGKEFLALGGIVALALFWRGGALANARMQEAVGKTEQEIALSKPPQEAVSDFAEARNAFQAAADADPFDPEPYLNLAEVTPDPTEREKALNTAVSILPSGKTLYRMGQFYAGQGQWPRAIEAFERARALDPHSLQNLYALGNAYLSAGKTPQATAAFLAITALEHTPYGEVRAMHEAVETQFAFAHAALADIDYTAGHLPEATEEYAQAANVLGQYWPGRNWYINTTLLRTPDKQKELADLYERVLQRWQECLTKSGKSAEAAQLTDRLQKVRADRAKDAETLQKAQSKESAPE